MVTKIPSLLVTILTMAVAAQNAFSEPGGVTCATCEKAIFNQTDICLASSAMPTQCANQAVAFFSNCTRRVPDQCRGTRGKNLHDTLVGMQGTNAWNFSGISTALAGARNSPVAQVPDGGADAGAGGGVGAGAGGGVGAGAGGGSSAAIGAAAVALGVAAAAGVAALVAVGVDSASGGCGAGKAPCGNYGVCCPDLQHYCPSDSSCGRLLRSCGSTMTACHN